MLSMHQQYSTIPDTDVAVLCAAQFESLDCQELGFKTGVRDKLRFTPIHEVCQKLLSTTIPSSYWLLLGKAVFVERGKKRGTSCFNVQAPMCIEISSLI